MLILRIKNEKMNMYLLKQTVSKIWLYFMSFVLYCNCCMWLYGTSVLKQGTLLYHCRITHWLQPWATFTRVDLLSRESETNNASFLMLLYQFLHALTTFIISPLRAMIIIKRIKGKERKQERKEIFVRVRLERARPGGLDNNNSSKWIMGNDPRWRPRKRTFHPTL